MENYRQPLDEIYICLLIYITYYIIILFNYLILKHIAIISIYI